MDGVGMEIDRYLSERETFSGSALVRQGGRTILHRGYGDADRAVGRPNGPETIFQIASVSKQFTAAAILLLQERGRLSVGDGIDRWVADCPPAWRPITIHQLLTHTSGIVHWDELPELSLFAPTRREELIRTFQEAPLQFAPGSGWDYSSPAYVLLAHIVERVSGERYAQFLAEHIFRPLGMVDTGVGNRAPHPEREAIGYSEGAISPLFELENVGIGAGDIWSTTEDIARWDAGLLTYRVLSEQSVLAMLTPHAEVPGQQMGLGADGYGYGWAIGPVEGHRVISHTGGNAGFACVNVMLPDDDAVIVLLGNDDGIRPGALGKWIVGEVLGVPWGEV